MTVLNITYKKTAPMGNTSPPENTHRKRKLIVGIAVILVLAIVSIVIIININGNNGGQEADSGGILIGAGVKEGAITKEEMSESTQESAEAAGSNGRDSMRVRLNGYPVFAAGGSEGNLEIENPIENVLCMNVEITLSDTGEVIYESGMIPPNHYIDNDKLTRALEQGEHEATAHVTLYDPDNPDAQFNPANFNLLITVIN